VLAVIVMVAVFNSGGTGDNDVAVGQQSSTTTRTEFGPLTASDVDLLVKVRQAGLWETPTGQQMQQRAVNAVVQEVGRRISVEHTELDAIVRQTAGQLGVTLPSQPSAQQQGWMQEISARTGADYDRIAVNLLDGSESNLLPVDKAPGGIGETLEVGSGKTRLELWWWIVACAALPMLLIEWWVYTRRVHL
jgi:hypothetical protein